jgi:hypothetical protein
MLQHEVENKCLPLQHYSDFAKAARADWSSLLSSALQMQALKNPNGRRQGCSIMLSNNAKCCDVKWKTNVYLCSAVQIGEQ